MREQFIHITLSILMSARKLIYFQYLNFKSNKFLKLYIFVERILEGEYPHKAVDSALGNLDLTKALFYPNRTKNTNTNRSFPSFRLQTSSNNYQRSKPPRNCRNCGKPFYGNWPNHNRVCSHKKN